jgi:hypothetical protein|tara:strand:+ start:100 stop:651 length:552 start_codon:yes stop_codon:yes gene_type:complete
MKKIIYLFLALLIVACSSDDEGNDSNSLTISWQVTVEGQTYENNSLGYGTGFGPNDNCNGDLAFEAYLPEIDTATRYYEGDLSHYYLTSDFTNVSVGSYPIVSELIENNCNLTFTLQLSDFSDIGIEISNGIHNVTSINQISSSNNETIWSVEGDFSGTFSGGDIESVSLTGSYRNVIATYQD